MSIKKLSLTSNHQYAPRPQQHSPRRSFIFKSKPILVRPQSYQRPSSLTYQKQAYPIGSSLAQNQTDHNIPNEYYNQVTQSKRQKMQQFRSPLKNTSIKMISMQENDSFKRTMMTQIQKHMIKLSSQIQNQSGLILNLQKKIHKQACQIQQKNNMIRTLIYKMQFIGKKEEKNPIFQIKKIQDVQYKLKIIINQLEEQKDHMQKRIEDLTQKIIKHFGNILNKLKKSCLSFMAEKSWKIDNLTNKCSQISNWQAQKFDEIDKIIKKVKVQIKMAQDLHEKENCSHLNSSKDTASHISSIHSNSNKNEDLFLSDYFFHPRDQEKSNIKIMEQLIKQRKKINQLPIRVYLDSFGRLKYFQSRTFVFDRKGNFSTPSTGELSIMQQKGWIKSVSE